VTLAPKITIVITTYGTDDWRELAWSRAYPSTVDQDAHEVIVHHEPDLPIGPARNAAALLASGDHLVFLDADDELEPGYVEAMRKAQGFGLPVVYQPSVRYVRKGRVPAPVMIPEKDLRTDNFLVIGTMVPSWLFHEVGGFNDYPHGFEDWSLWAKCFSYCSARNGMAIQQVPDAVYRAHINPQSKHRQMWRNRREQVAMHLRIQRELFPEGV